MSDVRGVVARRHRSLIPIGLIQTTTNLVGLNSASWRRTYVYGSGFGSDPDPGVYAGDQRPIGLRHCYRGDGCLSVGTYLFFLLQYPCMVRSVRRLGVPAILRSRHTCPVSRGRGLGLGLPSGWTKSLGVVVTVRFGLGPIARESSVRSGT